MSLISHVFSKKKRRIGILQKVVCLDQREWVRGGGTGVRPCIMLVINLTWIEKNKTKLKITSQLS